MFPDYKTLALVLLLIPVSSLAAEEIFNPQTSIKTAMTSHLSKAGTHNLMTIASAAISLDAFEQPWFHNFLFLQIQDWGHKVRTWTPSTGFYHWAKMVVFLTGRRHIYISFLPLFQEQQSQKHQTVNCCWLLSVSAPAVFLMICCSALKMPSMEGFHVW